MCFERSEQDDLSARMKVVVRSVFLFFDGQFDCVMLHSAHKKNVINFKSCVSAVRLKSSHLSEKCCMGVFLGWEMGAQSAKDVK